MGNNSPPDKIYQEPKGSSRARNVSAGNTKSLGMSKIGLTPPKGQSNGSPAPLNPYKSR